MRRLLIAVLTAMSSLVFGFGAVSASASPVYHTSFSAADPSVAGPIYCQLHNYTFTSGTVDFVYRDPSVGAHVTLINVQAVDEAGNVYKAVGAETYADPTLFVSKVSFVRHGAGVVESVNIVGHLSPNGSFHFFDFGTCSY